MPKTPAKSGTRRDARPYLPLPTPFQQPPVYHMLSKADWLHLHPFQRLRPCAIPSHPVFSLQHWDTSNAPNQPGLLRNASSLPAWCISMKQQTSIGAGRIVNGKWCPLPPSLSAPPQPQGRSTLQQPLPVPFYLSRGVNELKPVYFRDVTPLDTLAYRRPEARQKSLQLLETPQYAPDSVWQRRWIDLFRLPQTCSASHGAQGVPRGDGPVELWLREPGQERSVTFRHVSGTWQVDAPDILWRARSQPPGGESRTLWSGTAEVTGVLVGAKDAFLRAVIHAGLAHTQTGAHIGLFAFRERFCRLYAVSDCVVALDRLLFAPPAGEDKPKASRRARAMVVKPRALVEWLHGTTDQQLVDMLPLSLGGAGTVDLASLAAVGGWSLAAYRHLLGQPVLGPFGRIPDIAMDATTMPRARLKLALESALEQAAGPETEPAADHNAGGGVSELFKALGITVLFLDTADMNELVKEQSTGRPHILLY